MTTKANTSELQIKHLEKLLSFVPPTQLRISVQKTLFSYLLELDEVLPNDYKETIENHFFLIDFLDKIESSTVNNYELR